MVPSPLIPTYFNTTCDLEFEPPGNLYVTSGDQLLKMTDDGRQITRFGGSDNGPGKVTLPSDIAVDDERNSYIVDSREHEIDKYATDGNYVLTWRSRGSDDGQYEVQAAASFAGIKLFRELGHAGAATSGCGRMIVRLLRRP